MYMYMCMYIYIYINIFHGFIEGCEIGILNFVYIRSFVPVLRNTSSLQACGAVFSGLKVDPKQAFFEGW